LCLIHPHRLCIILPSAMVHIMMTCKGCALQVFFFLFFGYVFVCYKTVNITCSFYVIFTTKYSDIKRKKSGCRVNISMPQLAKVVSQNTCSKS